MLTYPGFRLLPAGVKKLLLESEDFFFMEAKSPAGMSLVPRWHKAGIPDAWPRILPQKHPRQFRFAYN